MRFSRPAPNSCSAGTIVHLRIVEFRRRRRIHDVAGVHLHRIGVGRRDMSEAGDVLVQLDVHQAVFAERMHAPRLGLARLQEAQRFRDRHLIDQHLARVQRRFGDPVPGLDHRCVHGVGRRLHAGGLGEELSDRDRVGGVVGALIDHLQHVVGPEDRRCHLHAAGAPAVGHRHFAARERHLIAGDRDRLQDGAADHPLGLLVQIGEIVGRRVHSAASCIAGCASASANSWRNLRNRPSSDWKST